jgi:predicted dehydrogenase
MDGSTVALVGCGNWGRHILRDLVSLECTVVVVAASEADRQRAEAGGAAAVVNDVDALPDVQGAVVAVPATAHAMVVGQLLPRRIPIYVEKPLAPNADDAEQLAQTAGDRVFVMEKWRYHPAIEALAGIATSGELGRIVGIETTRKGWDPPHADVDAIWVLLPHDLSIVRHILGGLPVPTAARADVAGSRPTGLFGLLGLDPWVRVDVSSRTPVRVRNVTLRCEGGIASMQDPYADHIEVFTGDPDGGEPPVTIRHVSTELPLVRELRAFVAHVRGGPPPLSSATEGAEVCRTIATLRQLAGLPA